jgi:hypothetical protein
MRGVDGSRDNPDSETTKRLRGNDLAMFVALLAMIDN